MKKFLVLGLAALLLGSPAVYAGSPKKSDFWAYLMDLGPAAGSAVSSAMSGKKPRTTAMKALQKAYEARMEAAIKTPAEAAKVSTWQATLEKLLGQTGALEDALVQEEIMLAQVTTSSSPLNVRAHPNQDTESLGKIQKGALLQVLKKAGDWYQIRAAGGLEGFATKEYITLFNDCRFGTVATNRSPLNIRAGKGRDSQSLGKAAKGSKLCVIAVEDSWCQIKYKGRTAYAAQQFISLPDDGVAKISGPKPKVVEVDAPEDMEDDPDDAADAADDADDEDMSDDDSGDDDPS